jgi:hypothetical protein
VTVPLLSALNFTPISTGLASLLSACAGFAEGLMIVSCPLAEETNARQQVKTKKESLLSPLRWKSFFRGCESSRFGDLFRDSMVKLLVDVTTRGPKGRKTKL